MHRKLKSRETVTFAVFVFILAYIAYAPPTPASGGEGENNAEAVLVGLQKRYEATPDFEANFTQETEIKTLNRKIQAAGRVYFKKPGRMLWRYDNPEGQVVLADGKFLYFYQPDQKQVLKTQLSKAFLSNSPLAFLLGIGDLKRDFKGKLINSEGALYILRLTPKVDLGDLGGLSLGMDKGALDIRWARIEDAVGNITTVIFEKMRRDVGLKESLFRLQVPSDVDTVELGKP